MDEVVRIRHDFPCLGGRKLYHLLLHRLPSGLHVGRDRFFQLLRTHKLLLRRRRSGRPSTTFSGHGFYKYPNLWKGEVPEAPNRFWVSDITYVRVGDRFMYLSLITDVYSHRIVGWDLSESLHSDGALRALKMALKTLPRDYSLIHHSDRGIQYCCREYVGMLKSYGIGISMTESGDPRENAIAERVNGILKGEWLDGRSILSYEDGIRVIGRIIQLYNEGRPHQSIGYLTPNQAHQLNGPLERKWKTYYKKRGEMKEIGDEGVSLS